MTVKSQDIVSAAAKMFARYGFSRTTMGDIASEAGVARQTLYNAFPGKEEILRAVARQVADRTFDAVAPVWGQGVSLDAKLSAFHQHGPLTWFEAIRNTPDWAELIDGLHKVASEEMKVTDQRWLAELTRLFSAAATAGQTPSMPAEEIADFFYSASMNAKYGCEDIDKLRTRLNTIKAATLALLRA